MQSPLVLSRLNEFPPDLVFQVRRDGNNSFVLHIVKEPPRCKQGEIQRCRCLTKTSLSPKTALVWCTWRCLRGQWEDSRQGTGEERTRQEDEKDEVCSEECKRGAPPVESVMPDANTQEGANEHE